MPPTEAARTEIAQLVSRYQALTAAERRRAYLGKELQTCQDFILPLFRALGWQTETDSAGNTDVVQQLGVAKGRVDYAFRTGNTTRFLLEAKHLVEDMGRAEWAEQAVGYAYNKGMRWAILTNFESVQVFNALREGPPDQHVVLNLRYDEFLPQLDRLWLLSKEAMLTRSLDEEAVRTGGADPREPVEKKLASVLKKARQDLYGELTVRDPSMPSDDIDDLVQSLLNRLVFIRTAEDRGIEEPRLREALNQYRSRSLTSTLLNEINRIFAYYADHYDSDLFPVINRWTSAYVDDTRLIEIANNLYRPPNSRVQFDFSAISADALGQIYEQYLGFEVRRPAGLPQPPLPGLDATAVETVGRREARRRRGVYYTPRFIVDYIVQHTVEALLYEDPSRLGDIRVADIACGSGSFLIRAYDVLLEAAGASISQDERLALLRRSIFGVDLDAHAIDVARLNLLLRALADPIRLPMLQDNLVVRNSLIHGSADELRPFFGDDWGKKQRLDFGESFPVVAAEGGFDVIVGNPPYVEIQTQDRREAEYLKANYAVSGNFDVYLPFIQRALELVRPGGRVGYIVPHKFMTNNYGGKLREFLGDEAAVEEVMHFGDQQVFDEVTTYTCVLLLRKGAHLAQTRVIRPVGLDTAGRQDRDRLAETVAGLDRHQAPPGSAVTSGDLPHPKGPGPWSLILGDARELVERLKGECEPLADVASRVFQGLITSADHVYHLRARPLRDGSIGFERFKRGPGERASDLGLAPGIEPEIMRPLLSGPDVACYAIHRNEMHLLFPYAVAAGRATLIPPDVMQERYPNAWAYLRRFESELRSREASNDTGERPFDDDNWYRFGRTQNLGLHAQPKLAIPATVARLAAAYDEEGRYCLNNVRVGGALTPHEGGPDLAWWVLAMLNSRVLDFVFKQQENTFRNGYFQANRQFIDPLPIPPMARDSGLAGRILALARDLHGYMDARRATDPTDAGRLSSLQRQFDDADREMDNLVADAYGLTDTERSLVFAITSAD
jgi:type I restriction-modification system DNA methylase subunit